MAKYYENIQHLEKMHGPAMPKEVSKIPELLVNHGIALGRSLSNAYAEGYKQDKDHALRMATSLDDLQKRTDASEYKKGAELLAPFATRSIDKRTTQAYELMQKQKDLAMQQFMAKEEYREQKTARKEALQDIKTANKEAIKEMKQNDNALATQFLQQAKELLTKIPGQGINAFNNYKEQYAMLYQNATSNMQIVSDTFRSQADQQLKYAETVFKYGDTTKNLTSFEYDQLANRMKKDFMAEHEDYRTNPERIDDIVDFIRNLENNLPKGKAQDEARAILSSLSFAPSNKKNVPGYKLEDILRQLPGFFNDSEIKNIRENIKLNVGKLTIDKIQEKEIYEKQLSKNFHRQGKPSFTEKELSPAVKSTEEYLIENPINGKSPDDLRVEAGENPQHANALNEIAAAIETDFNSDFIAAANKWGFSDVHTDIILTPPTTEGEGLDKFAIAWKGRLADFDYVVRNKFNNAQTLNSAYSATERTALSRAYKTMLPEQRTALFNTMVDGAIAADNGFINFSTYADMIGNGLGDGAAASFARLKMAGVEDGSFYKYQDAMLTDMKQVHEVRENIKEIIFNEGMANDIDQNILLDLSYKATSELWQIPADQRLTKFGSPSFNFGNVVKDNYAYFSKSLSTTKYVTAGKAKSDSLNKLMSETIINDPFDTSAGQYTIGELCSKRPCRIVNNDANSFYFMVARDRNDARGGKYEFLMADDYNNALILRP